MPELMTGNETYLEVIQKFNHGRREPHHTFAFRCGQALSLDFR